MLLEPLGLSPEERHATGQLKDMTCMTCIDVFDVSQLGDMVEAKDLEFALVDFYFA